jgi:hypothetical protein
MTNTYNAFVRNLVGIAGAVFLATTCMVAALGPSAVPSTTVFGVSQSVQLVA